MKTFNYRVKANNYPGICGIEVLDFEFIDLAIVTELPDNQGMSICNAFEDLVPQVANSFGLELQRLVWVEHWLARLDCPETYDLVLFGSVRNHVFNPWWIPLNQHCWQTAMNYFQEFYPSSGLVALDYLWTSRNLH